MCMGQGGWIRESNHARRAKSRFYPGTCVESRRSPRAPFRIRAVARLDLGGFAGAAEAQGQTGAAGIRHSIDPYTPHGTRKNFCVFVDA